MNSLSVMCNFRYNLKLFHTTSLLFNLPFASLKTSNTYYTRKYCTFERSKVKINENEVLNIFSNYGFSISDTSKIIKNCTNITCLSERNLINSLNNWFQCQFGEERVISLLIEHPNLLFVQKSQIERANMFLSSKFTRNEVYQIFFNAPKVLIYSKDNVEKKITYLESEMLIPKGQIINSGALGYSLHYIKERYEFLKRIGVFQSLYTINKNNLDHVNPRLDIIVSSTDEDFSTKVAGVSLFEYEVFQQMYSEEEDEDVDEEI